MLKKHVTQLWDFLLDLPVALLMYSQYKHAVTDAVIWLVYFNLNVDEIVEKMFCFFLKHTDDWCFKTHGSLL